MKSKSAFKKSTSRLHSQPHDHAADFEALLRSSMDELLVKTNAQREAWGLGEEEQWFLDEGSGEVVFTFPEAVISAPAQVIGSYNIASHEWIWAWADPELPESVQTDATTVRDYGATQGFQHLVTPSWTAEESHCWYMTALACRLCNAQGAFRGVSGHKLLFITFGEVRSTPVDESEAIEPGDWEVLMAETAGEFRTAVEDPDQQRNICTRYLRRGGLAGFAQDELIHRLGLAAPSVLDLAGYSADEADGVMGLLKTISDEEIAECVV